MKHSEKRNLRNKTEEEKNKRKKGIIYEDLKQKRKNARGKINETFEGNNVREAD